MELARFQDEKGAAYIDVNVGARSPEFMAEMVRKIQGVTAKPLSIDTPDPAIARAGLAAYDPAQAGGRRPILNSISAAAAGDVRSLRRSSPSGRSCWFRSRWSTAESKPCRTAEETYAAGPVHRRDVPRALPRREQ